MSANDANESPGQARRLRPAHTGKNVGRQFWGCTAYPECHGVVDL